MFLKNKIEGLSTRKHLNLCENIYVIYSRALCAKNCISTNMTTFVTLSTQPIPINQITISLIARIFFKQSNFEENARDIINLTHIQGN